MCETRTFVMAVLHWKQGLLCDEKLFKMLHSELQESYDITVSVHVTDQIARPKLRCKLNFVDSKENVVAKGENAGYQQFLFFQHCF